MFVEDDKRGKNTWVVVNTLWRESYSTAVHLFLSKTSYAYFSVVDRETTESLTHRSVLLGRSYQTNGCSSSVIKYEHSQFTLLFHFFYATVKKYSDESSHFVRGILIFKHEQFFICVGYTKRFRKMSFSITFLLLSLCFFIFLLLYLLLLFLVVFLLFFFFL